MNRLVFPALSLALMTAITTTSSAQHSGHDTAATPYAGQQAREIKSLSTDDLRDLRIGAGWGLARAAELNGVPGPAHLLELRAELGLGADQIAMLEEIVDQMRERSILAGKEFIARERNLDRAFAEGVPNSSTLTRLVQEAGEARATLRLSHLSAHLETMEVVTADQVARYAILRGYASDPCAAVPTGHDPAMWWRHNGCD